MTTRRTGAGWLAGLLLGTGVVMSAPAPVQAAPAGSITLLNINDFHGRIDTNTVKWAGTIEGLRAGAPGGENAVALLSAGDNIGASLFASATADDVPTIDVLNALEFDASAVGNHEFDRGFADFTARFLPGGTDEADFPYLGANVYTAGTTTPALPEYDIVTLTSSTGQTVKVGVIGVVTQETPTLVSPAGVANLTFGDPVAAVNRVADQLTDGVGDEADVIVAEYHEGSSAGGEQTAFDAILAGGGVFARIVNDTSAKVDVIFTGHTHQKYAFSAPVPGAPGDTRPIVQAESYGTNIGQVVLDIDNTGGDVTMSGFTATVVPRVTTDDAVLTGAHARVATVKTIVDAALANATTVGNVAIGSVTKDITTAFTGGTYGASGYTGGARDDRAKESTLGNLVADSLVASLSSADRGGAEIGVVNPGGLRAELLRGTDTVITYAEANAVLPFVNNLNTITLTGAQFKTLLEQQWQRLPNGNVASRPYLQLGLSSNVSYTFDPSKPEGSRITSIVVNGAPIDPARGYRIGTFSFLVAGGDNFHVFKEGTNVRDSGLIDRDAWIAYLTANAPVAPSYAKRSAIVSPTPTTVTPGSRITFQVSGLDLTSLGSPANTRASISIAGVEITTVDVANGVANVDVVVPSVPGGAQHLVITATPSNTKVTVPVMVAPTLASSAPKRLFDTRAGSGPDLLVSVPKAKVGPGNVLEVKVTGVDGVPATGVAAVSLNLTATNAEGNAFVTVYPCGDRKLVSNLNVSTGETLANAVVAPVSATGTVCFYANAPVDVIADVGGWFATGSSFTAVAPDRLVDTRAGQSPGALRTVPKAQIGPTNVLEVQVTDIAGVPATGVAAVSLNVTATGASRSTFVTVYSCGTRQLVSNLNVVPLDIAANSVITPVSATGTICVYANSPVDVIIDVNGWFATGDGFTAVGPQRVFDTRPGESPNAVVTVAKAKVGGSYVLEVRLTGLTGLTPATGISSVSLNVTATNPVNPGYVTAYPCGTKPPTSNLNFLAGQTVANAVVTSLSSSGTVCFASSVDTDLVVDINGWFA
ncbi:MAG: 5'-nucleotidase C-terminal domain-containing protein [Acidimicrobiales bacterium]|nr:5'-nucleotidase C-terminal domain-containing protein [Acidimicrobiales bacterium]